IVRRRSLQEFVMEIIYGINPVLEAIRSGRRPLEAVLLAREREEGGRFREIFKEAANHGVSCKFVPLKSLDRMAEGKNHQGVLAQLGLVNYEAWVNALKCPNLVLYVDRVTDCGNLGAILRSAAAFGVDWVLLSQKESAPVNDVVFRTSAGGAEYLRFARVPSALKMLRRFKEEGFLTIAAEAGCQIFDPRAAAGRRVLLLIGGEDHGVRTSLLNESDLIASIPMSGRINSLNVSVAAGIMLNLIVNASKV
ncbi:MAG: 23S rRNA (guanosine(2251)-2'-O)-methyltransferase RlmB, partial [Candidatus Wallbacteria bacterium]|nr:23S rRNA (guanosine(2251)-2'-O)-methyltransferase RlmB [Candidatus Wallbacteria bacterium]